MWGSGTWFTFYKVPRALLSGGQSEGVSARNLRHESLETLGLKLPQFLPSWGLSSSAQPP